jgi:hypothetical protein
MTADDTLEIVLELFKNLKQVMNGAPHVFF